MTKWILLFSTTVQIMVFAVLAKGAISSENFNTMIEAVNTEQNETAYQIWDNQRVQDYLRRKRTLQNVKSMIADSHLKFKNKY